MQIDARHWQRFWINYLTLNWCRHWARINGRIVEKR